jgi:copper transport outer membrane protein MctB
VFDLRYHVASLIAVFLALIIGILVGVGLSGSGVTKNADLRLAREQRDAANAVVDSQRTQIQALQRTQKAFEIAYPAVVRNLLVGKRIAVLFVGPIDGGVVQAIERTLVDAGAPPPVRVVSLKVPIDAQRLDNVLFGKGGQDAQYVGTDKLGALGSALGTEFEAGGQTPLWKLLGSQLVTERTGNGRQRADGVVVVRTVKPQPGDTARFLHGLMTGLAATDMPAVGVEKSGSDPSAVTTFRDRGLSSVDDIDLATGRAALALLLSGANGGAYGTQPNDVAILPPVPGG